MEEVSYLHVARRIKRARPRQKLASLRQTLRSLTRIANAYAHKYRRQSSAPLSAIAGAETSIASEKRISGVECLDRVIEGGYSPVELFPDASVWELKLYRWALSAWKDSNAG